MVLTWSSHDIWKDLFGLVVVGVVVPLGSLGVGWGQVDIECFVVTASDIKDRSSQM